MSWDIRRRAFESNVKKQPTQRSLFDLKSTTVPCCECGGGVLIALPQSPQNYCAGRCATSRPRNPPPRGPARNPTPAKASKKAHRLYFSTFVINEFRTR